MTFDEFVTARLGTLLRYATVVTGDADLADDVVQESLARAQARWARIGEIEQPDAYVKRIVLNEYLSWRRRLLRRAVPVGGEAIERAAPPVADPAVQIADRDAMVAMIAALPPRQRAVLALRYYEGHSDAEIADLLGCSEATVRSHASQALSALRPLIAGDASRAAARRHPKTPRHGG